MKVIKITLKTEALKELNRRKLSTINEIKDLDELKDVKQTELKDIADNKTSVEEEIETLKTDVQEIGLTIGEEKKDLEYLDEEILSRKSTIGFLEQKIRQKEERLQSLQHDIENKSKDQDELNLEIKKNINYLDTIETQKVDIISKSKDDKNYTFTIEFNDGTVQNFAITDLQDAYLIKDVLSDDLNKWVEDGKIPEDVFKELAKNDEPLPKNLYVDYKEGVAWSQFHIDGFDQEDVDNYNDGKITLAKLIEGHKVHCDLRMKFDSNIIQWVSNDNPLSYIDTSFGKVNDNNIVKSLVISELNDEETIISEDDAESLSKIIVMDKSYFIEPGEVGTTNDKFALMGTIWEGKAKAGVQRPDMHEYFLYPNNDLPKENKELFDGKFITRCFEVEGDKFWNMWKCNNKSMDSIAHADTGDYYPVRANDINKFGHEAYDDESKYEFVNK